jgi:hypothetical protein
MDEKWSMYEIMDDDKRDEKIMIDKRESDSE